MIDVLFLVLFVGLRHEVGGDWGPYLYSFKYFGEEGLSNILKPENLVIDIGYYLIGVLVYEIGLSIHFSNLVCAFISIIGLHYFVSMFKYRDLLFFSLYPYVIVVFAMGYTRQSVATSIMLLAIYFQRKRMKSLSARVSALFFHKSSIVYNIFFIRNYLSVMALIVLLLFFIYMFQAQITLLYQNYLVAQKESSGFYFRFGLILPSIVSFFFVVRSEIFAPKFYLNNKSYHRMVFFSFLCNHCSGFL